MWDFPHVICCCIRRQDSLRLDLLHSPSSARAAKTEKAAIISRPITTNMRLVIWFTEGFDTPDLLEAKTLLDELAE
jgi:hypothetical protein